MRRLLDELDALRQSEHERARLDAIKLALAYHAGQPTPRLEHSGDSVVVPHALTFMYSKAPGSDNQT